MVTMTHLSAAALMLWLPALAIAERDPTNLVDHALWGACSSECGGGVRTNTDRANDENWFVQCKVYGCDYVPQCGSPQLHLVVVLDQSVSLLMRNFVQAKQFIMDLVEFYATRQDDGQLVRLTFLKYDSDAQIVFDYMCPDNIEALLEMIWDVPFDPEQMGDSLVETLEHAGDILNSTHHAGVMKALLTITDGRATRQHLLPEIIAHIDSVTDLKVSIGIGKLLDEPVLNMLGDADQAHIVGEDKIYDTIFPKIMDVISCLA